MKPVHEQPASQTLKETTDKRRSNQTVNDLEAKAAPQVKGGRRISADPDEGGE